MGKNYLKGKGVIPLGAGWANAVALASGQRSNSSDPGHGWVSVIAQVNSEERGREPDNAALPASWRDVVSELNRNLKQ